MMLYRLRACVSECLIRLAGVAVYVAARLARGNIGRPTTSKPSAMEVITVNLIWPPPAETVVIRRQLKT